MTGRKRGVKIIQTRVRNVNAATSRQMRSKRNQYIGKGECGGSDGGVVAMVAMVKAVAMFVLLAEESEVGVMVVVALVLGALSEQPLLFVWWCRSMLLTIAVAVERVHVWS